MNKAELVSAFMARNDDVVTKAAAERVVNDVLDAMAEGITGGELALVGFGNFTVAERAAREGRNPQSGETIQIAAKNTVKFKAGKALKDAIN